MKYLVQAFTGGFHDCRVTAERLLERIRCADDLLDTEGVILGWSFDQSLYQPALEELHKRGKRGYLWIPVFSEVSGAAQSVPAVDYNGNPHAAAEVIQGEDFTFVCPSNPVNIENVQKIYRERFDGLAFDGVFLDKIRFSSFGNGFSPAMGCFCESCRQRYQKAGIDSAELKERMNREDKSFLLPFKQENGRYLFTDILINKFYKERSAIITDAVKELADFFHGLGLQVGLDVYAPLFSYFVGQDVEALSRSADFIKPMIYRVTDAPAGIPYEAGCMERELRGNGCESAGVLEKLWHTADLCSAESLQYQLKELSNVHCPLYTGFEINAKPGICHTNPDYIRQTVEILKSQGAEQAVLSWDILSDTRNHLELLAQGGK